MPVLGIGAGKEKNVMVFAHSAEIEPNLHQNIETTISSALLINVGSSMKSEHCCKIGDYGIPNHRFAR